MVWPVYLKLGNMLFENDDDIVCEADGTHSIVSEMKKIGRKYMEKNEKDMQPTFEHKAMTFLTPTMKKLNFIDYRNRYKLQTDVEDYIKKIFGI